MNGFGFWHLTFVDNDVRSKQALNLIRGLFYGKLALVTPPTFPSHVNWRFRVSPKVSMCLSSYALACGARAKSPRWCSAFPGIGSSTPMTLKMSKQIWKMNYCCLSCTVSMNRSGPLLFLLALCCCCAWIFLTQPMHNKLWLYKLMLVGIHVCTSYNVIWKY